jgi:3-hydroxyisobutyrate dehydrogenase/2-hydroxy-3-oxopropionate reductase
MLRVAVLGLGNMGSAMARRIAAQGFPLTIYNRTPDRSRALAAELSAEAAATPAAAAAAADVIVTMVSDDDALRELCLAPQDGVVFGAQPGSVTVQTSTVLPETVIGIGTAFAERDLDILDSPVSGSVTSTLSGELALMIGGKPAAMERARPILDALARRIYEVGDVGSGAALKLAVNHVIMSLNVALSEALVLAEAAGVERGKAYDVFAGGAAGAPYVQYKRAAFMEPGKHPPGFTMTLAEKDMRLIQELARETGTPLALADVNLASLQKAADALGGDHDFSELAVYLRSQHRRV